jgi:hypothetical protein
MLAPDYITSILKAESGIELVAGYAPVLINKWVKLAVAKGGHVTVAGNYAPDTVLTWAKIGGGHFTYRVG